MNGVMALTALSLTQSSIYLIIDQWLLALNVWLAVSCVLLMSGLRGEYRWFVMFFGMLVSVLW